MRFELNLPRERGRLFLDYLNSRLRERSGSYGGSAGLNEEGLFETTVEGPFSVGSEAVRLGWRVVSGLDGEVLFVEVTADPSAAPDAGWQTAAREFVTSVLAAALAEDRTWFFERRQFHYIGAQLDGEYWLPGFRLAPAYPEDPKPHLLNAEHVLTLDINVKAIDRYDASTIAEELARRYAARLSLLLNVGLYRPSYDLLWVVPTVDGAPAQRSERCQVGFFGLGPTITEMPNKGQVCPLGRYEGSLAALYRVAGSLLSLPPQARKILRGIDSAPPLVSDAFDRGARLYQVANVVAGLFPSVSLAYRVAAVEAISRADPAHNGFGQFVKHYLGRSEDIEPYLQYLYGDIRSAHFHAGEFPLGEFDRNRAFEPFMDPEKAERSALHRWCYQVTREAIIKWIASVVPDVPPDEEGGVGDTGKPGTP